MATIKLNSDAIPAARVFRITAENVQTGDLFGIKIRGTDKYVEYQAGAPTAANVAQGLADAIDETDIPEFQEFTATVSDDDLILTANTPGYPFSIETYTSESPSTKVSVAETVKGVEATNEVQKITIGGSPTGGTWTYTNDFGSGNETTGNIAYNASAAAVQAAIEALTSVTAGDVIVTGGDGGPYFLTWTGNYYATEVAEGSIDVSNLTGTTASATVTTTSEGRGASDEVVVIGLTGGSTTWSYKLNFGGQTTTSLDQDDTASTIQTALEALSSIGSGNILVYACQRPDGNKDQLIVLRFTGSLAETNVGPVTASDESNVIARVAVVQAGGQSTQDEIQFVNLDSETPNAGDYYNLTLDGETTANISVSGTNVAIEGELELLSGVSEVEVNGGNSLINNTNGFVVRFKGTQADSDVSLMTIDTNGLDSPGTPSVTEVSKGDGTVNEVQEVYVTANSGTFTLSDGTDTTSAIAYNASAATIKTRLETDIASITTVTVTGTGTQADPWVITYTNPGNENVPELTADGASLGGAAGTVEEVTAHNAGTDEQQTITVDGGVTGGTYTLQLPGYLVSEDIPYDAGDAVIESALNAVLGASAVSVSSKVVTFDGTGFTDQDHDLLVADGTNLEGGSGTETLTVRETQRSLGPEHWNDPLNWKTGSTYRVPEWGDDVIIEAGDNALRYGGVWIDDVESVDTTDDTLTLTDHDFVDGQKVRMFTTGTLPAGLSTGTDYYVRRTDQDRLQLSATRGGSAIDITDAGSGTHTVAVHFNSFRHYSLFAEPIGLPMQNENGYLEYRPRYARFGMVGGASTRSVILGMGDGQGTGKMMIDFADTQIDLEVISTGGSVETNVPALEILNENTSSTYKFLDGSYGIATHADENSYSIGDIEHYGGELRLGGVDVKTYKKYGGQIFTDDRTTLDGARWNQHA